MERVAQMENHRIALIAAIGARTRALGKNNDLLFTIEEDLKRFRTITRGHPVIMGRKTFESIIQTLGKPLPGRTNIVVTRDPVWAYDDVAVFHSIESALEYAKTLDSEEVFIGGGGEIYKQALPFVDKLYLTLIEAEKEADSFFPEYEKEFTKKTFEEAHELDGLKYRFVNLERE